MKKKFLICLLSICLFPWFASANSCLPSDFVYLKDIDPSIQQDIRYATPHNFVGRPIQGYHAAECILTREAALQLQKVQTVLKRSGLSLKVYDCYRPQMAVNDFIAWSKDPSQQQMKGEFYPRVNKQDFFKLGYVAAKSGHTRGSTVDLTIVNLPTLQQATYHQGQKLTPCYADYLVRFRDNSIDMGTGFDCMDMHAHNDNEEVSVVAYEHRQILKLLMTQYGFTPYEPEWWHFTLANEPYPNHYFNCPIIPEQLK